MPDDQADAEPQIAKYANKSIRSAALMQVKRRHKPRGDRDVVSMPYRTNDDLPIPVQRHLPAHAQDIYREAFNHAFSAHAGDPRREEAAHRIAWAAVKRCYVKIGDSWVNRAGGQE